MSTSTLGSSKSLNGKTIGLVVAAGVIVLAITGWAAGWYGGSEPAPAPAATSTTEQPPASTQNAAPTPAAPAAGQQQGTTATP